MSASPFPGMDPYLEAPSCWPDVHTRLMTIFSEPLTLLPAPHYLAELETRIVIDRGDDEPSPAAHYLVMVCQAGERPHCSVWPISVRQPLPTIPILLLAPDPSVPLDIGQTLRTAYTRARDDLRVAYCQPPNPPLAPADAAWAAERIALQVTSA